MNESRNAYRETSGCGILLLVFTILVTTILNSDVLGIRQLQAGNLGRVAGKGGREEEFLDRERLGILDI